jgi:hypothetical protein
MSWFRKRMARSDPQHDTGSTPAYPHIRDTVPTSRLLARTLSSLWATHWSSDTCNLALFAYGLDDGSFAVFPEWPTDKAYLECYLIDLDESFVPFSRVTYGEVNDPRVIGCVILDLLVPCDPATRFPDSQVLQLASGFGIAQESGAPVGILPSLYLTEGIEDDMISMFATPEWGRYLQSAKMP